ncbi:MAG TPA: DUF4156 domain-containing protein [Gammaproteobacteria bacterium]|nr:DUF4156 domain-containing protein [Gammaproteobacteria bacterium]
MKPARLAMIAACAALIGGCGSWINVKPQARNVVAVTPAQAASCHQLGKVTASVINQAGFFNRPQSAIETDLTNLARNRAVELGGDAVAPIGAPDRGKQSFGVYNCFGKNVARQAPANKTQAEQAQSGFKTIPYQPPL